MDDPGTPTGIESDERPSPGRQEGPPAREVDGKKVAVAALAAIAGTIVLCSAASYLTKGFSPRRQLLNHQGEVYAYLKPADFKAGDVVDLVIRIDQEDAKATAIREVTLVTRNGTELFESGRMFEDPPWTDTIWGDEGDLEEDYAVELPAKIGGAGLECKLTVDYVEARTGAEGGFRNIDASVTMPVTIPHAPPP